MTDEQPVGGLSDAALVEAVGLAIFGRRYLRAMAEQVGLAASTISLVVKGEAELTDYAREALMTWAKREVVEEQRRRMRRRALLKELRDRWQRPRKK